MATTKKRKPNKCIKGQPCGFSCISWFNKDGSKRKCSSPVDKEVVEGALADVPEIPVPKTKSRADKKITVDGSYQKVMGSGDKPALSVLKDVSPSTLKITKQDLGEDHIQRADDKSATIGIAMVKEAAMKAGADEESAEAMGHAVVSWLSYGYTQLSPKTYKATNEIEVSREDVAALAATTAAIKALPPVTTEQIKEDYHYKKWVANSEGVTKRWITHPDPANIVNDYKVGEEVTENGFFGTSIANEKAMLTFSQPANVEFNIKPKLDGTGKGRYMEGVKNSTGDDDSEGEILYEPGTKFKVTSVEKGYPAINRAAYDDEDFDFVDREYGKMEANYKEVLKADGFDVEKPYKYKANGVERDVSRDEARELAKGAGDFSIEIKINKKKTVISLEES